MYFHQQSIVGNMPLLSTKSNSNTNLTSLLSPLFKTKKSNNYLDIHKFNNLRKLINVKVIALGGINQNNYKKMRLINCFGMASISYIKMSPKIDDLLKIENGFKNRI